LFACFVAQLEPIRADGTAPEENGRHVLV
jgi:hypothetical protein